MNEYSDLVFVNDDGETCPQPTRRMLHAFTNSSAAAMSGAAPPGGMMGGPPGGCAFSNGKQVLELLTFDSGSIVECVGYLLLIAFCVHCIALTCLSSKKKKFAVLEPPAHHRGNSKHAVPAPTPDAAA